MGLGVLAGGGAALISTGNLAFAGNSCCGFAPTPFCGTNSCPGGTSDANCGGAAGIYYCCNPQNLCYECFLCCDSNQKPGLRRIDLPVTSMPKHSGRRVIAGEKVTQRRRKEIDSSLALPPPGVFSASGGGDGGGFAKQFYELHGQCMSIRRLPTTGGLKERSEQVPARRWGGQLSRAVPRAGSTSTLAASASRGTTSTRCDRRTSLRRPDASRPNRRASGRRVGSIRGAQPPWT